MKLKIFLYRILVIYFQMKFTISPMPSCSSKIYCQGTLLHVVQMAKPFKDSKQFVDMMMKYDEATIHGNFKVFCRHIKNISQDDVMKFVQDNFLMEDEMVHWNGGDYTEHPEILDRITVQKYRRFAESLIPRWSILGRKFKQHVMHEENISRYSIIPVPNGFIIPGGRFREFYYWDTYWIVVGLLHSDMVKTVRGMLENFLWLVEKYGFIPNGGRIYYLNRSQPPLLLKMVNEYFKVTKDRTWLKKHLPTMEKELQFWLTKRSLTFENNNTRYTLARYNVQTSTPRPESYSEDCQTCGCRGNPNLQEKCYREIQAAAESGWDFSSRWMTNRRNLSDLIISRTIPVDLNAFLAESFRIISQFYKILGHDIKQKYWFDMYQAWKEDLHGLLYNDKDGIWYDFNTATMRQNENFYASNVAPLWVNLFEERDIAKTLGHRALNYLIRNNVLSFKGGIPTSLFESGQQWDLPNAWPPLQSIVILALYRSGDEAAQEHARRLAERWLDVNFVHFNSTKIMYEKYNANSPDGDPGSGGEYEVQTGFGWSNGVVLELIGEFFTTKKKNVRSSSRPFKVIDVCTFVLILLFQCGIIF